MEALVPGCSGDAFSWYRERRFFGGTARPAEQRTADSGGEKDQLGSAGAAYYYATDRRRGARATRVGRQGLWETTDSRPMMTGLVKESALAFAPKSF